MFWADNSEEQGILHPGFGISKTGDFEGMLALSENLFDSFSYPCISPCLSLGRMTDGNEQWTIFTGPTPMATNLFTTGQWDRETGGGISIYPYPVRGKAIFGISLDFPGDMVMEIIGSSGKIRQQLKAFHYGNGMQQFSWRVVSVSGMVWETGFISAG